MYRDVECLKEGMESVADALKTGHYAIAEDPTELGAYSLFPTDDEGTVMEWGCPHCNKGWSIKFEREV